jgi:glycine/D-amino acid oxidase-like deaminating enzyme
VSVWLHNELPSSTQVVVIGGGIAGVSVAYHLALANVDVVLLEAGEIAGRASGRNDGQLLLGAGEHYNRVVSQFGPENARKLLGFIRSNNRSLKQIIQALVHEASLRNTGGLHLAETEQEFVELREAAKLLERQVRCKILSESELTALLPVENFYGALSIPSEATVQPAALTQGIAKLASNLGAKIYPHHRVINIDAGDNEHVIQLEDGRIIKTVMVVHCTSALAVDLDKSGFLKSKVFPYRGQIIATDPLDNELVGAFNSYAMSSNFCCEYFRTYRNQFILGGMRWSVKGHEEYTLDDTVTNPEVSANLLGYVDKHLPTLRGVPFSNAWTGIMAGTDDGLPLVGGIPGQQGVFALLAFNGYGMSFAFEAARLIREQIITGRSNLEVASMFNPRRFLN